MIDFDWKVTQLFEIFRVFVPRPGSFLMSWGVEKTLIYSPIFMFCSEKNPNAVNLIRSSSDFFTSLFLPDILLCLSQKISPRFFFLFFSLINSHFVIGEYCLLALSLNSPIFVIASSSSSSLSFQRNLYRVMKQLVVHRCM